MSSKPWILVVDDELSVRDSLQAWFRDQGWTATRTTSAKDFQILRIPARETPLP